MKILAIESSCDDTGVAIVEDGRKILGSALSSQVDLHKIYGGVVPEIASRMHIEVITTMTKSALEMADMSLGDVDAIGVTYAPGLIGSLLVGLNFAKGLAMSINRPLVPVHHIKSHIASLYISNLDLEPPFLCLVVSGGHSYILEVKDYTEVNIISKTRDDAAGEAFDKIGRRLGFDYPGGIMLDKIAETGNPNAFELPIPLRNEENTLDFSFSGLKTAMINIINRYEQKGMELPLADMSATFRRAVVDCLVNNFMRAANQLGYRKLAVAGGVSANSLLRRSLQEKCSKQGYEFFVPEKKYCGDNAAMVGSQAYYEYLNNKRAQLNINARASKLISED